MNIEKIDVKNFKKVSSLSVDLADITFLVGGNNSGKSSLLQAIHMAVSCAQRAAELQQVVIAESSLRYCPTGDFMQLGNAAPYENRKDGSRGIIEFYGKTTDDADASYKVEIYKARNYHNVGVDRSGVYNGFGQYICDPSSLFSVYVPGLAGITHHEEMQSYASVFRKAAGGEANLVFRNIIRLIFDRKMLSELEGLLFDIVGPCKFSVKFNQDRDLYVDVRVSFQEPFAEETFVPMDLSGTGVLQITQILAYVILFKPKLLLVDEPDSHLHPSRQALLSAAFASIVERYGCKIIISTHSRHLISAAPLGTKLVWLRNGIIESQQDNGLAAMLLDIGALDQIDGSGADYPLCTEDTGKRNLENCIKKCHTTKSVKVISYNGVTNAASAAVIKSMSELFMQKPIVIIHRDRDFLTDEEVTKWSTEYLNRGMKIFCPPLPDIESYYISAAHVAYVYGIEEFEAQAELDYICSECEPILRSKFKKKRQDANSKYWQDGGGPATSDLWPEGRPGNPNTMLGKEIVKRINEHFSKKFCHRKDLFKVESLTLTAELNSLFECT